MFDPDYLDRPVYGAPAIAEVLNLPGSDDERKRKAYGLLEAGRVDATKIGRIWVSTPRRLLAPHLVHLNITA
jgi:hypothetical protein